MKRLVLVALGALAAGCGGGSGDFQATRSLQRKTVLWVDRAVDEDLAAEMRRAGVAMLVVRRGAVDLTSPTPVLRISPQPTMAGGIPVASAMRLETPASKLDPGLAQSTWQGLGRALGGVPAELVFDLPRLPEGMDEFLLRLSSTSGLPVTPILTVEQLRTPAGIAVAEAAGTCVVPMYGFETAGFRGSEQLSTDGARARLAPLIGTGVRVRPAIVLHPTTRPEVDGWGEGVAPLCADGVATIRPTAALGRVFDFRRNVTWSRRQWTAGQNVEVRWMDPAQLHSALGEIGSLVLPEIAGWDLVSLPPSGDALGMGREALLGYLQGRGPGPEIIVDHAVSGQTLKIMVSNEGPFPSAISGSGHWLEVSIPAGILLARDRGDFDRLALGSLRSGSWKQGLEESVDAVRFGCLFMGPHMRFESGPIRLPSSGTGYTIRWRFVLSNGHAVIGSVSR